MYIYQILLTSLTLTLDCQFREIVQKMSKNNDTPTCRRYRRVKIIVYEVTYHAEFAKSLLLVLIFISANNKKIATQNVCFDAQD